MTDTFLYEDGVELSLSHAYSFIQNIAGNRIRNFTRIITEAPGFLDDSFKVTAVEKDRTSPTTFYLKLQAGGAVFGNGEVFKGVDFSCRVPITKSGQIQYLKVSYVTLYRTAQEQAFGEEGYAEEMDGVKLTLDSSPDIAEDGSELLIASINYTPDMNVPEVTDLRDPWLFFWSASTIVNPLEILDFEVDDISFGNSKSAWDQAEINIADSPGINSEASIILSIPQVTDTARHAWDLLVRSDTPETSMAERLMEPYPVSSKYPNVVLRLPQGLEATLSLRKQDAYRHDVGTEWVESDDFVVSDDETQIDCTVAFQLDDIQPLLGIRAYTEDDVDSGYFLKLWVSEQDNLNTDLPPHYILPIPGVVGVLRFDVPYRLVPYPKTATILYYAWQAISPGHRIVDSANGYIPFETPDWGSAEIVEIPFRADRLDADLAPLTTDDENGQVLYYSANPIASFHLPISQPLDEFGRSYRYLQKVEFINYAGYQEWRVPDPPDPPLAWDRATDINPDEVIITVPDDDPPVDTGDTLVISGSSDIVNFPNGSYTINYKYTDGTDWFISVTVALPGAITSGTCTASNTDSEPLANLFILSRGARGSDEEYSLTAQLGQTYGVHYPGSSFSDSETFTNPEAYPFLESMFHQIRIERVSGGYASHMNAMGSLKLTFVKKVSP